MALPARAQNEGGRTIKFRVVCLEHRENVLKGNVATGKSGSNLEVPFLSGNFTEQYEASFNSNTATFFVEDTDAPNERRVVASGKLAAGNQQVFLLLPSSEKKMPYRIFAMNDDEKSFPMGGVRLLNLCSGPIRLEIAGTTLKPVKPGKLATYPPVKAVDKWGMYQVRLDFATKSGEWIPVASPSWKGTKLKRDLVITRLDNRTKQPLISYYKDIPPWRKPNLGVAEDN